MKKEEQQNETRRHEHIPLDNDKVVFAWDIDCPDCKKGIKHRSDEIFFNQLPFIDTLPQPIQKEEECNHEWYGKRYCRKCGEIEMWGKITGNTAIDFENKMIVGELSTPSDNFIEEKMKELKKLLKCEDKNCQEGHYPIGYDAENDEVEWGGCPNCVVGDKYLPRVDPYKLESFLKSSLQEQREMIEREIDKRKIEDERNLWGEEEKKIYKDIYGEASLSRTLVDQKLGYNQALEDIKQLLNNNK